MKNVNIERKGWIVFEKHTHSAEWTARLAKEKFEYSKSGIQSAVLNDAKKNYGIHERCPNFDRNRNFNSSSQLFRLEIAKLEIWIELNDFRILCLEI